MSKTSGKVKRLPREPYERELRGRASSG
ncbi:hypothetical protein ACTIVE_8772 [Actinomadura verrucosospora]|uniref:Uncharacterized protein n=1 Tax=Actinomadura verrucosospora TaxID=46165 RepID=A0A7D3W1A9_ACTVE|nr:hypothetical protein ACTIVE_8772 [Actinomadura verrucosospora]